MTITGRTIKGFADGFGGGALGGAIYAGLVTTVGGWNGPSPWLGVFVLAIVFGVVEATRVQFVRERARARN